MSSPSKVIEEPTSSGLAPDNGLNGPTGSSGETAASEDLRPPAKRPISNAVIEISDTDSDDSDVCAVTTYQASADEVKRIRGADYSSSSSSSSDYSSDSESQWEDDSIVIQDEIGRKAPKAQLYPRANRMEDPKLNNKIQSQELIDRLKSHWQESQDMKTDEVTLTSEPFRLCLLHDFLANPDIINNIVDDMNTLDWSRKKMDLYEFHQTTDLASLTWQRSIRGIYELLKAQVMSWVSEVTGLQLSTVSASCSLYGPGDHLLVHDDLLGDRRVAFILYLAPWQPRPAPAALENGGDHHVNQSAIEANSGWSPHMGGALELLGRDELGPTEVVHSVYPRNNMLAFFKVGTDSYHQVSEVLSMELPRLSINGWFHGPAPPGDPTVPAPLTVPAPPTLSAPPTDPTEGADPTDPEPGVEPESVRATLPESHTPHSEVVLLSAWVDTAYLAPRLRAAVQAQMERESEVCLRQLLQPARVHALRAVLQDADVPWTRRGPPDQRRYEALPWDWVEALPRENPVRELLKLFSSNAFFRLLHDCTDLTLLTYQNLELQRWRAGDFTLLPSREVYEEARLEAVFYLCVPERPLCGGTTTYLAPEEAGGGSPVAARDAALVTVPPDSNALSLVYCDAGVASFTKYLSKLTMPPDQCFYILTCTYKE